ncbi:MAG: hypothetical protein R6V59_00430 [Dehalococcoidia bacterium]
MTYLPSIYKEFKQQFPEIAKAYDELAGFPTMIAAMKWVNEVIDKYEKS